MNFTFPLFHFSTFSRFHFSTFALLDGALLLGIVGLP